MRFPSNSNSCYLFFTDHPARVAYAFYFWPKIDKHVEFDSEVIFVLDRSGSMAGSPIERVRNHSVIITSPTFLGICELDSHNYCALAVVVGVLEIMKQTSETLRAMRSISCCAVIDCPNSQLSNNNRKKYLFLHLFLAVKETMFQVLKQMTLVS